jgi:hypothetical protein
MIHRFAAMLIVIFWVCMTGLLVVRQMYPELTRLNDVPVSRVAQLIFQHQQPSDLQIYEGPKETGYIHLQPRRMAMSGAQVLELHGNLGVELPGGSGRQRLSWVGALEMDAGFRVQRLRLNLAFQQAGGQLEILLEPPRNIARYSVKTPGAPVQSSELTLDEAGFSSLLMKAGMGPLSLPQMKAAGAQLGGPQFTAQTSSLQLNGETVSTYYFSMKIEEQVLIEAHLSQLGQVLRAQIPLLGYKFAPQNVAP